jgi:hypothetical protein
MVRKLKTGFVYLLIGGWFLLLSALLMLAINQALKFGRLYAASISPGPAAAQLDVITGPAIGFGAYALAAAIVTLALLVLVRRRPRRLLLASALMLLVFGTLNLYSGRHLLPQLLVWPWPWPSALLQEYTQALTADDLEAALRLTDGSDQCRQAVTETFSEHQSQLRERLGVGWQEDGISSSPHRSILTYYEELVPSGGILQPVPTQLVRLLVRRERGKLAWLVGLKVRYKPFLGARYLCGQGTDPEGWRFR